MSNIADLFQQIRSEIISLEQDAKDKATIVENLAQQENRIRDAVRLAQNELEQFISSADTGKKEIADDIAVLSKELINLRGHIEEAVAKKGELLIENTTLQKKVEGFRLYEEKAWKALEAKEQELLERERVVAEKEQFSPRTKSLLPPME